MVERGELYRRLCAGRFQLFRYRNEVEIGIEEGLEHHSCIRRDELFSLRKSVLTRYVGKLSPIKLRELNEALKIAPEVE